MLNGMQNNRHPVAVLYLVGLLDLLAVSLVAPAFPILIKSFGVSPAFTGAVTSIYGAVQLFSSPLVGNWSDRGGRYHVMTTCLIASSVGYLASGFCIESIIAMSLLRIMPGVFKHTQDLCRCCLLEKSRSDSKNQVLGTFNAISSVGFIIGPTVYGHLIEYYGYKTGVFVSYAICASLFLLNFFIISSLRLSSDFASKKIGEPRSFVDNFKNDMLHENGSDEQSKSTLDFTKFQRGIFASRFLLALAVMMFRSSFVLWLTHYHPDIPPTTVGYVLSYNGILGLFCGFLVSVVSNIKFYRSNEEKLQLHATLLVIFSFAILLMSARIAVIVLALTTLTMGTAVLRVCGIVLTVKYLNTCDIGKIHGFGSSIISIARFAAPLTAGVLQEISFAVPNFVCLFLSIVGLGMFYRYSYMHIQTKSKIQ